jgi:fibro-slime domain-containing protein
MSKAQPLALLLIALGCHHTNTDGTVFNDDGGTQVPGGSGGASAGSGGTTSPSGLGGTSGGGAADAGFTFHPVDAGPSAGGAGGTTANCGILPTILRDFKDDHPDMEKTIATVKGLVKNDLGPDDKPVYAPSGSTAVTSGQASFDQWYRDVPGVNQQVPFSVTLGMTGPGLFVFADSNFFPIDNRGFGNQGRNHNFHFTTEIHATFRYRGGEKFTFTGDDDVFIFVNKKLALDLGGVHEPQNGTIDFDAMAGQLGITPGNVYALDAFHAERHTTMSNFRIETSIDCLQPAIK